MSFYYYYYYILILQKVEISDYIPAPLLFYNTCCFDKPNLLAFQPVGTGKPMYSMYLILPILTIIGLTPVSFTWLIIVTLLAVTKI